MAPTPAPSSGAKTPAITPPLYTISAAGRLAFSFSAPRDEDGGEGLRPPSEDDLAALLPRGRGTPGDDGGAADALRLFDDGDGEAGDEEEAFIAVAALPPPVARDGGATAGAD